MKVLSTVVCTWILLAGCARDADELEDPVLAEVGDSRITASQLIDFAGRLPAELKTKKKGVDGYREYLQTIIDKEIFLQEATKRGLDKTPEVAGKIAQERAQRLLRLLFEREFVDNEKVAVSEAELQAAYEAAEKEREVKLRLIIVATESQAVEILAGLAAGADFAVMALEHSLHESTAEQGGELQGYLTPNRIPNYLQQYIATLAAGEYSEPIRLPNDQYGVYQVMHARPVSYATSRNGLEAELKERKTSDLVDAFMAKLRAEIDFRANGDVLRQLQQWVADGRRTFSDAERAQALFAHSGGVITIGDFWDYADELKMGFSGDIDESVRWFAEDVLLIRDLFILAANRAGLDRDERLLRWQQRRRDALLLVALRQTAVKDQVEIAPEAARKLYDERPEMFTPPEEVTLQEIMVKTAAEADLLKERIAAGEDMGALADEHTLRVAGKGAKGRFHIHAHEQPFYRELIDAVRAGAVGRLQGPIEVTAQAAQVVGPEGMPRGGKYYSIFKVMASNFDRKPEPWDKAEKRARALLKRAEESRLADQFLMGLRRDYRDRIVLYEDRLAALVSQ